MRRLRCLLLVGVCLVLVPAGARADGVAERVAPDTVAGPPPASIHQQEWDTWATRRRAGWVPPADPPHGRVPLQRKPAASNTPEVFGFHPYWMGGSYLGYDWSLLSVVSFFGIELDAHGNVADGHLWPWNTLVATAHAQGVRVLVTAILFSTSALDTLLADPVHRSQAIATLASAVQAGGADGVCIDFEGVPGSRKADLVTFVNALRPALDAVVPGGATITVATPAVDWNNAYDYDLLAFAADKLVVMAYDYHGPGSTASGPVAPLGGWGAYNVAWTIQDYVTWGAPRDRMLLGVPYYGYIWETLSGDAGSGVVGPGTAVTYAAGVTETVLQGSLWDVPSQTPWYRWQDPDWFQLWYDDAQSLGAKYDRVWTENLAGVSIWALGYDGTRPELWDALRAAFGTTAAASDPDGTGLPSLRVVGTQPFAGTARVRFAVDRPGLVRLGVYDVRGRPVRSLWNEQTAAGTVRELLWDGRDARGRPVPAGVYWVRLASGSTRRVVRLVHLR